MHSVTAAMLTYAFLGRLSTAASATQMFGVQGWRAVCVLSNVPMKNLPVFVWRTHALRILSGLLIKLPQKQSIHGCIEEHYLIDRHVGELFEPLSRVRGNKCEAYGVSGSSVMLAGAGMAEHGGRRLPFSIVENSCTEVIYGRGSVATGCNTSVEIPELSGVGDVYAIIPGVNTEYELPVNFERNFPFNVTSTSSIRRRKHPSCRRKLGLGVAFTIGVSVMNGGQCTHCGTSATPKCRKERLDRNRVRGRQRPPQTYLLQSDAGLFSSTTTDLRRQ